MKCIRDKVTEQVLRVSDHEARSKVEGVPQSTWVYVPKAVWKAKARNKHLAN